MSHPAADATTLTAHPSDARTSSTASSGKGGAQKAVRLACFVIIAASVLVILRALPTVQLLDLMQKKVATFGPWGPVVFGAAYFIAAVLFVPGSALTLAAGAIFGLVGGFATVSVSSTAAAGASFLIARYLARERVRRMAETNRTFGAIDKAIAQGGWKIIALLRLSPAVPFSLGNYLYGLTPVKFWPYLLASWIAMMPGTFLYVYLGFVGKTAAAGSGGKNPWQYVLLGAGLLATIVVSVYVTRLARKALRETALKEDGVASDADTKASHAAPTRAKPVGKLIAVAGTLAVLAACAQLNKGSLGSMFGPPKATLGEAYANTPSGAVFDHSAFDTVLKVHVSASGGFVDYEALKKDAAGLDAYITSIATANIDTLGRDERLAFLINAYNAFTLRLILDHYPVDSIKDIPSDERWDAKRWTISGDTYSLNQIEHELIRPKFAEPRIHFALVCAAIGCPPLRNQAYTGSRLEEQLADQSAYVHAHSRWFVLNEAKGEIALTALYDWYGGDFTQKASSVAAYAAQFSPDLVRLINAGKEPRVTFLDYSWKLNSVANRGLADGE
ncbi:MAG: DUF547 domain-containing protein [Phycisphaerales bacterium]